MHSIDRAIEDAHVSEWEKAHEELKRAFAEREQLGAAFWEKLLELEVKAYDLGRQLHSLYMEGNHRERLTPAAPVNPRADTEREVPALPFTTEE